MKRAFRFAHDHNDIDSGTNHHAPRDFCCVLVEGSTKIAHIVIANGLFASEKSKSALIMSFDEVSFLLNSFLLHTSPNATSYWFVTAENDGTSSCRLTIISQRAQCVQNQKENHTIEMAE